MSFNSHCGIIGTCITFHNRSLFSFSQATPIPIITWKQHLQNIYPFYFHLISKHKVIMDDIMIKLQQEQTTITICSDGSVYLETSVGSWIIEINGDVPVIGANDNTGPQEFQNSYQSEAHALLAGIILLQEFQTFYRVPPCSIKSICDSQGLILRINNCKNIS